MLLIRINNKLKSLYKRFIVILFDKFNFKNSYSSFLVPNFFVCESDIQSKIIFKNKKLLFNISTRRFKIFGSINKSFENKDNFNKEKFTFLSREINSSNYKFINWHTDPLSKYTWRNDLYFWDSFYSPFYFFPKDGPDIKVPRELSRFNHISILASKDRKDNCKEFILQVIDWITHNELNKGLNWACTMDVALRVTNWIIGLSFFKNEIINYPKSLEIIFKSIEDHGIYIYNNLEYYGEKSPTENHYLSNIVGLIYIGVNFPQFKNSDIWLYFGIQEIIKEMDKQVYDDGGNYEASSGYHRLVGELFLTGSSMIEKIPNSRKKELIEKNNLEISKVKRFIDLKLICKDFHLSEPLLPINFYEKLLKMANFTNGITKPNGFVFQFGDNDSGRAHILDYSSNNMSLDHNHFPKSVYYFLNQKKSFNAIKTKNKDYLFYGNISNKLKLKSSFKQNSNKYYFKNSGLVILKNKNAWLGAICSSNGKNKTGGHNHNDKLSFELNIFNEDVIVDGGCPFYTNSPKLRNSYRSTKAHSTVYIEGIEQDKWGLDTKDLFKLKETTNPKINLDNNNEIIGSHNGYPIDHIRKFKLFDNKLIIKDYIESFNKKRIINFNLASNIKVDFINKSKSIIFELELLRINKNINLEVCNVINPIIKKGYYSEAYGCEINNLMISCEMTEDNAKSTFYW